MALSAMYAAATGMRALDTKLNVVANNLANVSTVGFKRSRVNFEDLMYQVGREPGVRNSNDEPNPLGIEVGLGTLVSNTQLNFATGNMETTDRPLDLAIDGPGFFQVKTVYNGQELTGYTRAGNFIRNANGQLTLGNSEGSLIEPPITIPQDAADVNIGRDGTVTVRQQGTSQLQQVGQLQNARFVNPEGLLATGKNIYVSTDGSGEPIVGNPLQDGLGGIIQGTLEQSNVDPVRELVDLIFTQRGFELNSQSIQAADETLRVVTNLRRG
jgi:flagellar basal-body rod protein FlgG